MNRFFSTMTILLFAGVSISAQITQDQKMAWFREAKFGNLLCYGPYSQLHGWWKGSKIAEGGLGEWIMENAKISIKEYEDSAASKMNPTKFNAKDWVSICKNAGMKYFIVLAKYHDGFSTWDTKVPRCDPYDMKDFTPYKQDILAPLCAECKLQGIRFCVYYSIMDWHHPYQSNYGENMLNKAGYVADMKAQLKEIIEQFDPGIIWFDGHWKQWWTEADGKSLHAYLLGLKPDIIVNNRVGKAGPDEGDFGTPEQNIPATGLDYDWESCMTMNGTWGYQDFATSWQTPLTLLTWLVDCVSKGGNLNLGMGPDETGAFPAAMVSRLATMGQWTSIYGESIYGAKASIFPQVFSWGKVTVKPGKLFLHVITWPTGNHQITIPRLKNAVNKVYLLNDTTKTCAYTLQDSTMTITLPATAPNQYISVIAVAVTGNPRTTDSLYYVNDTDPAIVYNPGANWTYYAGRGYGEYKDDVHATQTNGADWTAYSDDLGHLFRRKPARCRSEATAGISLVPMPTRRVSIPKSR